MCDDTKGKLGKGCEGEGKGKGNESKARMREREGEGEREGERGEREEKWSVYPQISVRDDAKQTFAKLGGQSYAHSQRQHCKPRCINVHYMYIYIYI